MPRWSDALLDPMRLTMDPPADAAVESVFRSNDVEGVNALMRTLVRYPKTLGLRPIQGGPVIREALT